MLLELIGAGMQFDLTNRAVRLHGGRYASILSGLPDMPVSTLTMRLGGDSRVISLRGGLCSRSRSGLDARIEVKAQDGRIRALRNRIAVRAGCQGRRQ